MKSISASVTAEMIMGLGKDKAASILAEGMVVDIYREARLELALQKVLLKTLKDFEKDGLISLYRYTREPIKFTLEFGKLPMKISEGVMKTLKVIEPDPQGIVEAAMHLIEEGIGHSTIETRSPEWLTLRNACNKYLDDTEEEIQP